MVLEGNVGIGGRSVENETLLQVLISELVLVILTSLHQTSVLEGLVKYRGRAGFGSEGLNSKLLLI
jgi:hypothetical protein